MFMISRASSRHLFGNAPAIGEEACRLLRWHGDTLRGSRQTISTLVSSHSLHSRHLLKFNHHLKIPGGCAVCVLVEEIPPTSRLHSVNEDAEPLMFYSSFLALLIPLSPLFPVLVQIEVLKYTKHSAWRISHH